MIRHRPVGHRFAGGSTRTTVLDDERFEVLETTPEAEERLAARRPSPDRSPASRVQEWAASG